MAALRQGDIVHLQHLPHVCPNETKHKTRAVKTRFVKLKEAVMAYVNSTLRTDALSLRDLIAHPVAALQLMAQRRRVYTQTVTELGALSDRDLADLGLHRSMIRAVAKDAAYGK